jgi:hypothetical protein
MAQTLAFSWFRSPGERRRRRVTVQAASPHVPEFSRTLQSLQAMQVDVMVLGDLHLRDDTMEVFCEAREQMKVRCAMLPPWCCAPGQYCEHLERHRVTHHTDRLKNKRCSAFFEKIRDVYMLS